MHLLHRTSPSLLGTTSARFSEGTRIAALITGGRSARPFRERGEAPGTGKVS